MGICLSHCQAAKLHQPKHAGLFATFCEKIVRPPHSEGFLFKGVTNLLTKGGKKTAVNPRAKSMLLVSMFWAPGSRGPAPSGSSAATSPPPGRSRLAVAPFRFPDALPTIIFTPSNSQVLRLRPPNTEAGVFIGGAGSSIESRSLRVVHV